MAKDALVTVFSRNAFYRGMHFLVLGAFALAVITIGILFAVLLFLMRNPPHPLYFATDNVSRLIKMIPVNVPNMSQADVISWTTRAIEAAYSYDYVNYRSQLQNAQQYFSDYGWSKYMEALVASNNLNALTQRKMIALAKVVGPPKVLAEGILGGKYAWRFQFPVLVTYWLPPYDDTTQFSNPLQVTVIVQRQEELKGYEGLGVVQLIGNIVTTLPEQPAEISATPTTT